MKIKNTIPYIILQQGGSIKYNPTESNTEIPEIEGYKPQFSNFWYRGDNTKKEENVPVQEEPIQEDPIQETPEIVEETPVKSEWSDIKTIIKNNEGFTGRAKKSFGEPHPTVGYGFFNILPDGRKITDNMTITEQEADRQLDIALNKLSSHVQGSLDKYGLQTSPEQFNILLDLSYHGGAGLVDRLLKESNGDSTKIGSLLLRYATTAKYGDKSITSGLKNRALRRSQGWNKYTLKGKNGLKLSKFQNSGKLPFWSRLARQLQSAPSNGETTIAAHNADLNRQVEQARKEAKNKGQNPDRAEEEVYKKGLRTNGAIVGGVALGALATTVPAVAETVKFATKTPVGKKALQKVMKDTAISMAGGTAVDTLSDKMTGMSFGRYVAGAIPGARNLYDRSDLARFGIDMLNPGYLGLSGSKALIEGTQKGVTNLAHKVDNAATIVNARLTGKLKFGSPTTYTGIHQSNTPITKVQFPFNRWDVTTHGADPNGFWLTLAETPNTEGTMASRPFASRWTATAQKPLIQTGEIENLFKSKNNLRNAIVRYGKRRGADAFEFRGIKDNALPVTDVVMVTDKTSPIYKGGIAKVNYAGPTTGKTTYIKANPNSGNIDLDAISEYKALRQQIADKLELDYRDPKVTDSPEYQKAFNQFISKWSQDTNNAEKTLWGSSKALLRSNYPLDNQPFIPDFSTFVKRNQARGFKETPEQLKSWYDSIIESYPQIKIDNKFIGERSIYSTPKTSQKALVLEKPILSDPRAMNGKEIKITPETAKSITDAEWDSAYNTAIESGNIAEAQRLSDLHGIIKAGGKKPLICYRGEKVHNASKYTLGSTHRPNISFTTTEPAMASSYAEIHTPYSKAYGLQKQLTSDQNFFKLRKESGITAEEENLWIDKIQNLKNKINTAIEEQENFSHPQLRKLHIYSENPTEVDVKGSLWSQVGKYDPKLGKIPTTDDLAIQAQNNGYDALIIKNVRDTGNGDIFFGRNSATDIVSLNTKRAKLADAITYDDAGNIIPLSKRHDFTNPDIRYGIIPLSILGGSTILNLNKKPNSK